MPTSETLFAKRKAQILSRLPAELAARVPEDEAEELVRAVLQHQSYITVLRRLPLSEEEPALPLPFEELP